MGLKFINEFHQMASGTAAQELSSVYKTAQSYQARLLRFWLMCSDTVYPAGAQLDIEVWQFRLCIPSSGGSSNAGQLAQDNGLNYLWGLTPQSNCRQNDTTLITAPAAAVLVWAGGMQIWQGLDVVLSSEPSISSFISGSPNTYDAFAMRLASAPAASVKLSGGMLWEESY